MHDASESMTYAYDVRTAGRFRSAARRAARGVRRGYDVSRRGVAGARQRALTAHLAIAAARDAG